MAEQLLCGNEGGFRIEVSRMGTLPSLDRAEDPAQVGLVCVREELVWAAPLSHGLPLQGMSKCILKRFALIVVDLTALKSNAAATLLPATKALQGQLGAEVVLVLGAEAMSLANNVGHCAVFRSVAEAVAGRRLPQIAMRHAA